MSTVSSVSETPSVRSAVTPYLWGLFALCFVGNVMGGTVSTLMSVYLPVVVSDIASDRSVEMEQLSALLSALFFVGWAIGGLTMGVVGDRIGRVRSLAIAIITFGTATLLMRYAHSWSVIIALRFLAGFGVGAMLVLNTTLLSEVWPEKSKAVFLGVLSVGFPVGIFSSGAMNFFVSGWRDGVVLGVVPLLLGLAIWVSINESERWKESKTSGNHRHTREELGRHRRQLLEGAVIFSAMLIGLWAIFSWVPTWVQSLLTTSDGQRERGLSMMLLGIGGLSGGFLSGWVSNLLGVRRAMIMCFSLCFTISALLFLGNSSFSILTLVEIGLLSFTFGISQGLMAVYIPQLFPVAIRAMATGFCFNIGRFFTATSVFFVGALVSTFGGYGGSLFAFSFVFLVGLVFVLFNRK
ncbi:MFS transporter [Chryseolinea sp. T2]|uniref:MFS transporter n=1 Tax=Chryseolinea sp. T2 TaxID=3129255 RepID=UPI003077B80F